MSVAVASVQEVCQAVAEGATVLPVGGGTKPALSATDGEALALDMTGLSGIVDYNPAELTLTACAGTPVAEIEAALAEHDQYLPFDPPLARAGATLAGVVASGTSGAGAFRHGGVRDFVIGVQFVDGRGRLINGGGRVVKNAAGFDLPKLMVGSAGRLGVIVQLSVKVFPRPQTTSTLVCAFASAGESVAAMARLGRGPLQPQAVDRAPDGRLWVQLGGDSTTLPARVDRCAALLGDGPAERLDGDEEASLWAGLADFSWVEPDATLIRVAVTVTQAPELLEALARVAGATVHLSVGGNLAWVSWPGSAAAGQLDALLRQLGLAGMRLIGPAGPALIGRPSGGEFAARLTRALDPDHHFLELWP